MSIIDRYLASVTLTLAVEGFLRKGDLVLLGERKQASFGLGQNLIAGIGGKIGDCPEIQDETPEAAMDREASEEVGIQIVGKRNMGRVRFIFTHKAPDSTWNQDVRIFTVTEWDGTPTETESTKPAWFDIANMPWSRMWADNELWLPQVLTGQRVDATFLFCDDNKIEEFRFDPVE